MKAKHYKLLITFALFALVFGCKKEAKLTYLNVITFPPSLTISNNEVVITPTNKDSSVLTLKWPAVDYSFKSPVIYTIEFTSPDDIAWQHAYSYKHQVGNDILGKAFTGAELNKLAVEGLALMPKKKTSVAMRVQAYVNAKVYSNTVKVDITPVEEEKTLKQLWVPGGYQGWDPGSPNITLLSEYFVKPNVYDGYIYISAINDGKDQFKITPQPSWTPIVYGDKTGTEGNVYEPPPNTGGFNMKAAEGIGYYEVSIDLNTKKWRAIKTVWGLIGDATPGGWNSSTDMAYDPAKKEWSITTNLVPGVMKFRANNSWDIQFGTADNGKLVYAQNEFLIGAYVDKPLHKITEAGSYTVIMNLSNAPNYTYKVIKN